MQRYGGGGGRGIKKKRSGFREGIQKKKGSWFWGDGEMGKR